MATKAIYQSDLAAIHNTGYTFHWEQAAPAILQQFDKSGMNRGTIVDLGCGGGHWIEHLAGRGYDVVGIDVSPAMVASARERVPRAKLIEGSFAEVPIPRCDAVTSLGEPINYLNDRRKIQRTYRKVYEALRPGGLFMFDVRHPADGPVEPRIASRVGEHWACFSEIEEDYRTHSIVRRITSFVREGDSYRRSFEIHRLKLHSKSETTATLRGLGFRVRVYNGYGEYQFSQRQAVYVARKPR